MSKDLIDIGEKAALGGYYLFIGNTLSTLILAVNSIIIARLLGPDNYGVYSISLVVPTIFVGLVNFGVPAALTQFTAKLKSEGNEKEILNVVETSLFFELIASIIVSAFCLLFSDIFSRYLINRPELSYFLKVSSLLISLQTISTAISSIFIGVDKMQASSLMLVIGSLTKIALSPLLVILGFSITGAITGLLLSNVAIVMVGLAFLRKYKITYIHLKIDTRELKAILKYGLPIYFSSLVALILTQYQTIILTYFANNVEVGNYQIITLFSSAIGILLFPFQSLFPSFTKSRSNSKDLSRIFERSVKYSALLIVPASLMISIISKDLIYAFFGSNYNLAPLFLSLYILINILVCLGSAVMYLLFSGIERTEIIMKSNLINLFVFLPLAPTLTHLYGILGLILSIIVSTSISQLYYIIIAKRELGLVLNLKSSTAILVISTLAVTPSFIFLRFSPFSSVLNILLAGAIFCCAYLVLLPATKTINNNDLEIFNLIINKNKNLQVVKPVILFETMILKSTSKK